MLKLVPNIRDIIYGSWVVCGYGTQYEIRVYIPDSSEPSRTSLILRMDNILVAAHIADVHNNWLRHEKETLKQERSLPPAEEVRTHQTRARKATQGA